MAIGFVGEGSGSTTGTATATTASATYTSTGGNALVLWVGITSATPTVTGITDSSGTNVWTQVTREAVGSNGGELWYCLNAAAITSVTATISAVARYALIVGEYSGVGSVGQHAVNSTTNTSSTVSITIATGNNWVVGGIVVNGIRTFTASVGNLRVSQMAGSAAGTTSTNAFVDNTNATAIATALTILNGSNVNYETVAVELIPPVVGVGGNNSLLLMGCGN